MIVKKLNYLFLFWQNFILSKIKRIIRQKLYYNLDNRKTCILKAAEEQGLIDLMKKIETIVDDNDIVKQYTNISAENFSHPYWKTKLRAQHSFQISLVLKAIEFLNRHNEIITIVDIGDSAGTHILYLKNLLKNIRSLSVNLDANAVEKIKNRGLEAICCRAEELDKYNIKPDIFMTFQTLEHILSPIHFLKLMSDKTECRYFIITVPYQLMSRMGLHYIRTNNLKKIHAENLHIFELSPEDWKLIFKFCGWQIVFEKIYYQYPKKGLYKYTSAAWRANDFEGFYGVILEKNETYKKLYLDWGH